MVARIFDDQGGAWSGGSEEFRRSFGPSCSQWVTGDYVARALGFVVVDRYGASIQMRLAPELVSQKALFRAFDWIDHLKFERISVGLYRSDWAYKLCISTDQARAHVARVMSEMRANEAPALISRGHDAERLPAGSAFQALVSDWHAVRGIATQATAIALAQRHLGSQFVLTETCNGNDQLIFNTVGNGFELYGPDWARAAVGCPVHMQPDAIYGAWVSDTYQSVLKNEQAMLQDVDALVTSKAGNRARLRIRRAVLPLLARDGRKFVIGGSVHDDAIDLRSTLKSDVSALSDSSLSDLEVASSRLIKSQRARATRIHASA